ncbi:hypothetical protein [Lutibacter sp.]|uniref:hypothetical protein n=1 Tax=Lutibacter sp. TaxID=1925666 RepID=UPI00273440BB|nr:hypothetical protein [Lutibacter sp.]MDP3313118.1 hypothetical protein [Lutibacter sp.]
MKKSKIFLSAIALIASTMFISSCGGDNDSPPPPPPVPSKIKKISMKYTDNKIESWEFIYDANKRVTSISNIYDGGTPEAITYDYSVAGKLTINKNGTKTVYILDTNGRVVKELWNAAGTEWEAYEYDADGIMKKVEEYYGGKTYLKYNMTIASKNVTNRLRYNDDAGSTLREDRVFTYTVADNLSNIPQIYAVDSEWKNIGGLFGKQNQKLALTYTRKITSNPTSNFNGTFAYTFDTKNRVATQTKNGVGSAGPFSESWTYTYYED